VSERKTLKDRALELGFKAMGKLMEDPGRAQKVGRALETAQKTLATIDATQTRALHAAGIAAKDDFKAAGKRVKALRERAESLGEKLARIEDKVGKPKP
jgi:hypothetical protein